MKHIDTIVLVEDIKKSKQFYMDIIGLEILHDWGSMVIFKDRFAIHQADLLQPKEKIDNVIKKEKQGSGNLIIYFEAEEIEKEYEKLKKYKVEEVHEIAELPWGKIFRLKDPDGHIIEIGESKKE